MDSVRPSSPLGFRVAVAVLVGSHAALWAVGDLAARPFALLGALAAGFAALAAVGRWGGGHATPAWILGVAVVLRGLLLPLPPTLSDDVLRYVWDGRVLAAGLDPYRLPPEAESLAALRDARWEAMPHKHVATVYPPVALGFFALAAASAFPIATLKILFSAADLLACWLLLRLARARDLPACRVAFYAWNPLVVLEVAGSGHLDSLVVLFQVAAVLALSTGRSARAGLAAAAGVLAKLSPAVLVPAWLRLAGSRQAFLFAVATPLLAAGVLVAGLPPSTPPGLVAYGVSWEFDGPLYEPLHRSLDRVGLPAAVKDALDAMKERTGHHETWNRVYPFVYPELLAKLLLGAAFLAFLAVASLRARDALTASGRITGALLLASATVYPWYLLWVLPWAALCRHRAWLAASATAALAYVPQHTDLELWPTWYLLVWAPFFLLLPVSRWSSA